MLIIMGVICLLVCLLLFFTYRRIFLKGKQGYLKNDRTLNTTYTKSEYQQVVALEKWWEDEEKTQIKIRSFDHLTLTGHLFFAKQPTNKFVVLAHGYTSKGKDMARIIHYYLDELGINVLSPDARSHGASEGKTISLGWFDRLDYLQWCEYLVAEYGENIKIILHGLSMGASSLMLMLGENPPPQVKFLVEDCGFSDLSQLLSYNAWRKYKVPHFVFTPLVALVLILFARIPLYRVNCLQAIKETHLPVIFVHGGSDQFIPTQMSRDLYQAKSGDKELVIIHGAGHGESWIKDEQQLIDTKIREYMRAYTSNGV